MRFKHWLLTEDFHASDSDLTGDAMLPTNAGDYAYANNSPVEHNWLQWKWDQEKKQGRSFHNIDVDEFIKRGYVSVQSMSMPDKRWRHRNDSSPNLAVMPSEDLTQIGVGKDSKQIQFIQPKTMIQWVLPLDQMFKDKPSGKWQSAAEDTRWRK